MAMTPTFPIDFNAARLSLVKLIQSITGIPCIVEERKGQTTTNTPRPPLPYCSLKFMTPAGKIGTDAFQPTGTADEPSSIVNFGGVRRAVISFKCYAETQESAYNFLSLLEASFDTDPTQQTLRANKLAFWQSMGVTDITSLLTAGYEGRASLDVVFGITSSMNVDLGEMDSVPVNGEITWGSESADVNFTVTEET